MTVTATPTPADLHITPRDRRFGRGSSNARLWHGGRSEATAIYNALSTTFPEGEAFFVESVRAFREGAPPRLKVMLYITRNFVVDRTAGALELMRQDGVTGIKALTLLLWYLWVSPGMFRKISGAWVRYFLPGFHPWNEDDRDLLHAFDSAAAGTAAPRRKVRRAV